MKKKYKEVTQNDIPYKINHFKMFLRLSTMYIDGQGSPHRSQEQEERAHRIHQVPGLLAGELRNP